MKRQSTLAATLLIAALPLAAQASVASRQALEANHEPLNRAETSHAQETSQVQDETRDSDQVIHLSGSAAMVKARHNIALLTEHRTNLTSEKLPSKENEHEIGHDADW